ncbi:CheR family methyltransferase, partial [Thermodesulfobacteriota bacterium]
MPDLHDWNVFIMATDINPRSLRKAALGTYGEWSFRDTPAWVKRERFRPGAEGTYRIDPSVRKMVRFAYHNLAHDAYPSIANNTNAMDVIFCRNVLMYFGEELIGLVTDKFHRCLVDGGWLFVSPTDCTNDNCSQFKPVGFPGRTLYRKAPVTPQPRMNLDLSISESSEDSGKDPSCELPIFRKDTQPPPTANKPVEHRN